MRSHLTLGLSTIAIVIALCAPTQAKLIDLIPGL